MTVLPTPADLLAAGMKGDTARSADDLRDLAERIELLAAPTRQARPPTP